MAEPQNTIHRIRRMHQPGQTLSSAQLVEAVHLLDAYAGRAEARDARSKALTELESQGVDPYEDQAGDPAEDDDSTPSRVIPWKLIGAAVLALTVGTLGTTLLLNDGEGATTASPGRTSTAPVSTSSAELSPQDRANVDVCTRMLDALQDPVALAQQYLDGVVPDSTTIITVYIQSTTAVGDARDLAYGDIQSQLDRIQGDLSSLQEQPTEAAQFVALTELTSGIGVLSGLCGEIGVPLLYDPTATISLPAG